MDSTLLVELTSKLGAALDLLQRLLAKLDALQQRVEGNRKEFLTVNEVAKITNRSPYTVRQWIRKEMLHTTKVQGAGPRGKHLIPRSELERLIARAQGSEIPADAVP